MKGSMNRKRWQLAIVLPMAILCPSFVAARTPKNETRKVMQMVERVSYRSEKLGTVLSALQQSLGTRITIAVCSTYTDVSVSLVSDGPERLDELLKSLALQVGSPFRLYVGQHAERARPTFYCGSGGGTLLVVNP